MSRRYASHRDLARELAHDALPFDRRPSISPSLSPKYLDTSGRDTPAASAMSMIVVAWKPFSEKHRLAALKIRTDRGWLRARGRAGYLDPSVSPSFEIFYILNQ